MVPPAIVGVIIALSPRKIDNSAARTVMARPFIGLLAFNLLLNAPSGLHRPH